MIIIGPIRQAGKIVVYNPDNPLQVWQFSAEQWTDLATATFAECVAELQQIETTGTYAVSVDLPDDETYIIHLYRSDASSFSDATIAELKWFSDLTMSAIGDQVWSHGDRTLTNSVRTLTPSLQFGLRRHVAGDSYGENARSFLISSSTGGEFPVDLDDYEWTAEIKKVATNPHSAAPEMISASASVGAATGSGRYLHVNVNGEDTASALGDYSYSVKGTHSQSGNVWTVEQGTITYVAS